MLYKFFSIKEKDSLRTEVKKKYKGLNKRSEISTLTEKASPSYFWISHCSRKGQLLICNVGRKTIWCHGHVFRSECLQIAYICANKQGLDLYMERLYRILKPQ